MALNINKKTSPADVNSSDKGDLIVNNGTDIIGLPIGANKQILTVDSITTEGIKWSEVSDVISTITGTFTPLQILGQDYPDINPGTGNDIIGAIATNNFTVSRFDPIASGALGVDQYNDANISPLGTPSVTNIIALVAGDNDTTSYQITSDDHIVIDFKTTPVNITSFRLTSLNPTNIDVYTSIDGVNWTFQGNKSGSSDNFTNPGVLFTLSNPGPARYLRLDDQWGSLGRTYYEIEVYGSASVATPTINYNLVPAFNTKFVEFTSITSEVIIVDLDTNSNITDKFFTVLHCNNGNSISLNSINGAVVLGDLEANDGESLIVFKAGIDKFLSIKSNTKFLNKGDLLTFDGIKDTKLSLGVNGQILTVDSTTTEGIKWASLGGLNLTEVKYITTLTIDKAATGTFDNTKEGVFHFIGTDSDTVAYSNVINDNEVDIFLGAVEQTGGLVDRSFTTSLEANQNAGNFFLIDLKRDAYLEITGVGYTGGTATAIPNRIEGSNNGTDWTIIDNINIGASGNIYAITPNANFYRYFRLTNTSGVSNKGWDEIEIFGNIVPNLPTYNIVDADNNKMLLVPFGNPTQVNMTTGIGSNGFTCQVTPTVSAALPITINPLAGVTFIGQNFTIDNIGEVATIVQASPDTYVVSISRGKLPLSAKGDLLTHDGTEPVVQTIGADNSVLIADSNEAGGLRWDDVSNIVSTPFTSQRLDINNTLQLTNSNARYLYLSAVGGTQDVILTNPPSTNDFFYIVNRDGANPIQIKETSTGAVVQTINSNTPVCQAQFDGVEWQCISLGSI